MSVESGELTGAEKTVRGRKKCQGNLGKYEGEKNLLEIKKKKNNNNKMFLLCIVFTINCRVKYYLQVQKLIFVSLSVC